jgi:sigma-B regulation protein RsbU (phosphoserine phosphatase)
VSPEVTVIGVLYLDSQERGSLASPTTQSALELLTTEAAIAIENARLYRESLERARVEEDLKLAAAIQRALLPVANRAGDFVSTAGISIPCREMGGDFFDYVDLADGRFGFMLGDVAGKGSPAAVLAAAVVGMFSAEATYQTSAAAVVTRLNRGLLRRHVDGRFLTAVYGILASDGTLTYCNAGHNFPVLVTATGARRLDRGGLILGLFEQATFEEETITLQPGDRLIVFSDGVTDACDVAGHPFDDDRLIKVIETHRAERPQALLEALTAEVRAFCGAAPANDDMTLLIVQYEPSRGT